MNYPPRHICSISGFTLSELLIALAILGVIATFTIPKVLQSQQDAQRKAVVRETFATLNQLVYDGYVSGEIRMGSGGLYNHLTYVRGRINAIKFCPNNAQAEGCWAHAVDEGAVQVTRPGMVLSNGATIAGIENTPSPDDAFILDWNGAGPPNVTGEDQAFLSACYDTGCPGGVRPGMIYPANENVDTYAMLIQVFGNN